MIAALFWIGFFVFLAMAFVGQLLVLLSPADENVASTRSTAQQLGLTALLCYIAAQVTP